MPTSKAFTIFSISRSEEFQFHIAQQDSVSLCTFEADAHVFTRYLPAGEATMATQPKTKKTEARVSKFLAAITDEQRRADCERVAALMQKATGESPTMWGEHIVGFGRYRHQYASGTTGDWPVVGFSPRKNDITLYLMPGFPERAVLLTALGKHKTGKSCLYLKQLADVHLDVLRELLDASVRAMEGQRVRD